MHRFFKRRAFSPALLLALGAGICPTDAKNDFSISLSASSLSLAAGNSGTVTVNIARHGYTGPVEIGWSPPTGFTIASDVSETTGNSMDLTVTAVPSATEGKYTLSVSATGGGFSRGAEFDVTVTKPNVSNKVLLFIVPSATDASSYISQYGLSIDASYEVLLRIDVAANTAAKLESNYSPSYAPSGKYWYSTDDRIFVGQEFGTQHTLIEHDLSTFAALGVNQSLARNTHLRGCVAVAGNYHYYRYEPTSGSSAGDLYRANLNGGGGQLLVPYNADDYYNCHLLLADKGLLYDVWEYPSPNTPSSYTLYSRDLTTGAVGNAAVSVSVSVPSQYLAFNNRFALDNGTFYYMRVRTADSKTEVWKAAANGSDTPAKIIDEDLGFIPYFFDVDDGHLMLASLGTNVNPKNAKVYLKDLTSGQSQTVSLGVSITNIVQVFAKP